MTYWCSCWRTFLLGLGFVDLDLILFGTLIWFYCLDLDLAPGFLMRGGEKGREEGVDEMVFDQWEEEERDEREDREEGEEVGSEGGKEEDGEEVGDEGEKGL
jgi:hypothetical protein